MTRPIHILISVIFFFSACSKKTVDNKLPVKFTTFEIGYLDDQFKGLSFWTDSNRIFLSPQGDTVKYGLLNDSILRLINIVVLKIVSETSIKPKENSSNNYPVLSLKIVAGVDTISFFQRGDIDQVFIPLIRVLEKFIDSTNHSTFNGTIFLKTAPPPPPRPFDSSIVLKMPK